MPTTNGSPSSRSNGLTRDRVVDAAIELLDAHGEPGLTFRALAHTLGTGHGAIQWHVATKGELLTASTVTVLTRSLDAPAPGTPPHGARRAVDALHAVALGLFDALDAHPWLGSQLFAVPWQPAMAGLWERIGRCVEELGVPDERLFSAVSTLVSYIVGVGSQNALNAHVIGANQDRDTFLDAVAARWEATDPADGSVVRRLAAQLRVHDDRAEFLAGIDIIVAGLTRAG